MGEGRHLLDSAGSSQSSETRARGKEGRGGHCWIAVAEQSGCWHSCAGSNWSRRRMLSELWWSGLWVYGWMVMVIAMTMGMVMVTREVRGQGQGQEATI